MQPQFAETLFKALSRNSGYPNMTIARALMWLQMAYVIILVANISHL